jgi:hypothetical protein
MTVVTMMVMMTAATLPAATRDGSSTDARRGPDKAGSAAFRAGNGASPEAGTAGCNGNSAGPEAGATAGCNGHAAATSKAAATAGCDGAAAATASTAAATATADSRATAAPTPDSCATAAAHDSALSLNGARRDHRQHERDRRCCTQNLQIDHIRLHFQDMGLNHFRRWTFPNPRTDRAHTEPVPPELYAA